MKGVLWKVAKRLSYIQDARCLKVKHATKTKMTLRESNMVTINMVTITALFLLISSNLIRTNRTPGHNNTQYIKLTFSTTLFYFAYF